MAEMMRHAFWENLTGPQQRRYWDLSLRIKNLFYANQELGRLVVERDLIRDMSEKEYRDEYIPAQERKINHWIRSKDNHVKIDPVDYMMNIDVAISDMSQMALDNQINDSERIECEKLAMIGWRMLPNTGA